MVPGTQSQVNFTQGLIVSSAESFYQHNFAVPDCVDRPKGAIYDVYVSAVKSADQFWVQIVDETANSLDELQGWFIEVDFKLNWLVVFKIKFWDTW